MKSPQHELPHDVDNFARLTHESLRPAGGGECRSIETILSLKAELELLAEVKA